MATCIANKKYIHERWSRRSVYISIFTHQRIQCPHGAYIQQSCITNKKYVHERWSRRSEHLSIHTHQRKQCLHGACTHNHALQTRGTYTNVGHVDQCIHKHTYEGCSKWIAYFYLETSNFKLAQKYSFHALEVFPVARNAKFQPMYPLLEGVTVRWFGHNNKVLMNGRSKCLSGLVFPHSKKCFQFRKQKDITWGKVWGIRGVRQNSYFFFSCIFDGLYTRLKFLFPPPNCVIRHTRRSKSSRNFSHQLLQRTTKFWASFDVSPYFIFFVDASTNRFYCSGQWLRVFKWQILCLTLSLTCTFIRHCVDIE